MSLRGNCRLRVDASDLQRAVTRARPEEVITLPFGNLESAERRRGCRATEHRPNRAKVSVAIHNGSFSNTTLVSSISPSTQLATHVLALSLLKKKTTAVKFCHLRKTRFDFESLRSSYADRQRPLVERTCVFARPSITTN
jgi:hypothetical protein